MIREKLRRIYELHETYQRNQEFLSRSDSVGSRASLRRQQVFLKEKIAAALKEIQLEVQPKLFVVYLITHQEDKRTVVMRAETKEDIKLYIQLLQIVRGETYLITSVQELPTIYEGHITFVVK